MKSTTIVHIAIRNIGDAQDAGKCEEGTVSHCILWMARQISEMTMAGRIVIGIGRSQDDALRGISAKSAGRQVVNEDMKALLESVFNDDAETDDQSAGNGLKILAEKSQRIAGDDYAA